MSKKTLIAGATAVAIAAVCIPAHADNILTNQWYAGQFGLSGTPLLAGGLPGTDGPVLPLGTFAGAMSAPGTSGGVLSAVITLPTGGYLTVTDVEESGDQFSLDVNGSPAMAAVGDPTGLGGQQAIGSDTSVPVPGTQDFQDIAMALANADFSSGTFQLPAGTDTITGTYLGGAHFGDMDFIVEGATTSVPEPTTLSLLSFLLMGLGLTPRGWARRKA